MGGFGMSCVVAVVVQGEHALEFSILVVRHWNRTHFTMATTRKSLANTQTRPNTHTHIHGAVLELE